MKKFFVMVLFSMVVLSSSLVFGEGRGMEGESEKLAVGSIRTAGNVSISSVQILSRVRSRVGELFDPATAAEDARRIAELDGVDYAYYNTDVVGNKIQLTFVVVERNLVRSIVFIGNERQKAKTLRKKLDFKIGDYLDPIIVERGSETVAEFYRRKGFAFVRVGLDAERFSRGEVVYTVDEGPRVKIEAVEFSGNEGLRTKSLRKAVKTRTRKFLFWPRYYSEQRVDEDTAKLQNIYYRKGYLDAAIKAESQFSPGKRKVHITFAIDEGPVYAVERIEFTGVRHFGESQLMAELKLEQGQVYSEQKARSDVRQLLKLYREIGFIEAAVEHHVKFVPGNEVAVEFAISEGKRFRIGRVGITGNEQTHDKVVRRVLDEYEFQPGQWYNAHSTRGDGSGELERRVQRMVLAESATITPAGEVPGRRDAQVSIIEGQTGMVMVGAGASTDLGLIGQLIYEERNFDISDWPESFREFITGRAFRGAGQHFRIALQPGTEVSEFLVSFTEPYFDEKPVSLNVVGSSWERERESYDEQRLKGYVGFEKRYKNRWRRSISFRAENVEVDGVEPNAPKEIEEVEGRNALVGIRLGIGKDLTDDRFNPSEGYRFDASYEQVGGDHTFGIVSGTYKHYRTIHEDLAERKTVLVTKLLGASTVGDAPPFEKFYAGGSGLYGIRGFDYRGVSTRGLPTLPSTSTKREDPIGSDWIFLASAEVIVPLAAEGLSALVFVDSGAIDTGGYRVAAGVGIQILIPQWFGPVPMRFELGAPLMKEDEDDTQVFSFSVGRLF
ncbi:MAG: outer membrane protein assembly factor BamA [Planctomycetota bacterium]|nr:MAG: outer membrane protein assembly factor BamA [Planctomycetota bacterium]